VEVEVVDGTLQVIDQEEMEDQVEVDQVELQAHLILQVQAMSLRLVRHKVMMVEMVNQELQTQIEVEVEEELVQQAQQ
jgi:hypothetical protein